MPITLLIPAIWLALQAIILVASLAIFTFRPGLVAQRFAGLLAGIAIAAVFLVVSKGLLRGAVLGHIVAVSIYSLESLAFGVSLVQGRGGVWQAIQLVIALVMLGLLFSRSTRLAIGHLADSETNHEPPTYTS